jgi:hydrogenase-1 operon protein HyaF
MMEKIEAIPVKVVHQPQAGSGNARALLHELAGLLEGLACRGESASIDLSSLPLAPEDYRELHQALGAGTVVARVQAAGTTEVRETDCPGAWWVTHANEAGAVLAELIEVCAVPAILLASAEDVAAGLARLRQALALSRISPLRNEGTRALVLP